MEIIMLVAGIIVGLSLGWFIAKSKITSKHQSDKENSQKKYNELEVEAATYRATMHAQLEAAKEKIVELEKEGVMAEDQLTTMRLELKDNHQELARTKANQDATLMILDEKQKEVTSLKDEMQSLKADLNQTHQLLAIEKANNEALVEKLKGQMDAMEEMGKKFNLEFENIANKIFDTKTERFTELNKTNLRNILEPLGKNIEDFRKQVDDVYNMESKERFSLGERVKELAVLNQEISQEAKNLTKALKGEAKTQGRWGEMILESILEKSGLRKNEQYFIEHELLDDNGKAIRSDLEGKKMRPDAVIKYPDNRNVIIDSKVSLNAFTRLIAADDVDEQKKELDAHLSAIKNHIISLSAKGYDDYDKALDFVMMFIPSEPAYITALQGDSDLWNFAYDKRILLLSPTNLITSLKMIVDLWKREYQNRNSLEIAERGAKLYDKFVGFVENMDAVGQSIDKAGEKYRSAYKQLSTGNDNLVAQATKLKNLGLKTKKELSNELVRDMDLIE
ncbi:DNA recombination protein RmuC [Petrocella atlantisensis]|uniref:DNA recombination protein RmuC n=1 Tax=Petrocella atlantisensis TaxID=2173034 RepID=A0A3P7P611_9FIRM|nr:DNA recombination protein RmuC [Petrocella atlantisensis]VDN48980.1 DNA recombination protein RmuC [Petrocella atlantisensis]